MPAPNREGAAVPEDELDQRVREELRLGHETHLPPDEHPGEEVIPLAEVVRGEDHGPAGRNVLGGDRAQPVEEHARGGEDDSRQVVDPVRLVSAGALVEAVEVLRGAGILVDLWLEVGHSEIAGVRLVAPTPWNRDGYCPLTHIRTSYSDRAHPLARSTARRHSASRLSRSSAPIRGSYRAASRHMASTSSASHVPVAIPARYAAPRAVVSVISGTMTGAPSTSAWNCISHALATAPPSAFSSSSALPAAASCARTASTVW